jgi:hypothetical protein
MNDIDDTELTLREQYISALKAGAQLRCPTCERYAQVYRRRLYYRPIKVMYGLLAATRRDPLQEWHHYTTFSDDNGGEFAKMRHWGFIMTLEKDDPLSPGSGYWQLTRSGELFLRGRTHQPAWKDVLFNKIIETSDQLVNVETAIEKKFDYRELLEGIRFG